MLEPSVGLIFCVTDVCITCIYLLGLSQEAADMGGFKIALYMCMLSEPHVLMWFFAYPHIQHKLLHTQQFLSGLKHLSQS